MNELEIEFRAQIRKALDAGLNVSYLDGHMGVENATPEHWALINKLADEFGLVVSGGFGEQKAWYDSGTYYTNHKKLSKLQTLPGRVYRLVIHPGLDTPEMRAVHLKGEQPSTEVANSRSTETKGLVDPIFLKTTKAYKLHFTNYEQFD